MILKFGNGKTAVLTHRQNQTNQGSLTVKPEAKEPVLGLAVTNEQAGTGASPAEEVFKVVLDNTGRYACTDTGRQLFYLKSKAGNTIGPVEIRKFLRIKAEPANANSKITGMEIMGHNLVIYVDGQAHEVKLSGGQGNN